MAKHILTSFGLTDKYIAQFGNIMHRQLIFYARNSSAYSSYSGNSKSREYELALKTIVVTGYSAVNVVDRTSCLLDNYHVLVDKICVEPGDFDRIPISKNINMLSEAIPEMVHLSLMAFNLLKPQPLYIHDFAKAVKTVLGSLEMFKSNYDAIKRQAEELLRKIFCL